MVVGENFVVRIDVSDLEGVCSEAGDPACDGVCGALDSSPGDCDGVCDASDAVTASADCDGVCGDGEAGGFDCDGSCLAGDEPGSGDCDDVCSPGEADGSRCDDGLFCTSGDVCNQGVCAGTGLTAFDDGIACTADSCDEAADIIVHTPNHSACDNQLFCDGAETCDAALGCQAGTPPSLDDGIECTTGSCDEGADVVVQSPDDSACDNQLFCDGAETCDAALGCQAGTPPSLDDGIECTTGSCDEAADVVVQSPDDSVCDNQLFCDGAETCDAALGCQAGTSPSLDDGIECTTGSCDEAADVVVQSPDHTVCDNQAYCDGAEVCDAQEGCVSGLAPCVGDTCDEDIDVCAVEGLAIQITTPESLITVGASPIDVDGLVNSATAEITLNGVGVQNSGGTFSAAVSLEEGHNTIVARATEDDFQTTDSISVSLDLTPPYVTIESHTDGETVYSDAVTVTGLVNDIVRGTVEESQAEVSVNGFPASISNRSYAVQDVPLTEGPNTITVLGTDQVGNVGSTEITLHYAVPVGRRIELVSGQDQSGAIGTVLPDPIVVQVVDDALAPVADTSVVFRVTQGAGDVEAGTAEESRATVVQTDAEGYASTTFRLGTRSGTANHKVRAKVVGYDDEAVFYASATGNIGNKVSVNSGNNQRGAVGQVLPEPLVVVVTDDGANVVQGARVLFEVTRGGGTLSNGETSYQAETDSDGRATSEYTLDDLEGIDAQRITATLVDAPEGQVITAGFTATAFVPGDPGDTTISGVVLDNQDTPLSGVTIRIDGATRQTVSDEEGQFQITDAPIGPVHLIVDGSTTTAEGEYPSLTYNLVAVAGVDNPLPAPIYMVKLDTEGAVYAGPEDVVLELERFPGFKLEIAADSVAFPDGSH